MWWRSEDNRQESVFSFLHVYPRDQPQVVRLALPATLSTPSWYSSWLVVLLTHYLYSSSWLCDVSLLSYKLSNGYLCIFWCLCADKHTCVAPTLGLFLLWLHCSRDGTQIHLSETVFSVIRIQHNHPGGCKVTFHCGLPFHVLTDM